MKAETAVTMALVVGAVVISVFSINKEIKRLNAQDDALETQLFDHLDVILKEDLKVTPNGFAGLRNAVTTITKVNMLKINALNFNNKVRGDKVCKEIDARYEAHKIAKAVNSMYTA